MANLNVSLQSLVKDAAKQSKAYQKYNKDAVSAIANSNTEEELNKNLQEVGDYNFQKKNTYYQSLAALALGDLLEQDKDCDMEISLQEFIDYGLEAYKGVFDKETLEEIAKGEDIQMEFYAMDYNMDDKVGLDELMLFYSMADESL